MASEAVTRLAQDSVRVPPSHAAPSVASPAPAAFAVEEDDGWVRGYRRDAGSVVLARVRGSPQATLDLHRLTRAVARRRLVAFIAEEAERGVTSVLVVVGKGHHSQGGEGVLRTEIAAWLTTGTCAHHVLAFETAPRTLGGSGAVLVVLGRR
jgi:DNA-nicking Smr family endonuclease